jgi:uncharacterized protein with HEPN domain
MRPEERDAAYLWDMLDAAKEISQFVQGLTFNQFEQNKAVRYAVERQLLVIGEAANHVSPEFKNNHAEIPWAGIIAQRNVLAHEYGEILIERVWVTAKEKIPFLVEQLGPLIPPLPD